MLDGNRSRELLTRLWHTNVSFGDFGVDGFFLLSGFLIVQSWQKNPELIGFLHNRVLRIVPGYLVAVLLSTLAVGLLAPGIDHFFRHLNINFVYSVLALSAPSTPPVLRGAAYPKVNTSLWTVSYEFRCYILIAVFGICGLFRRPIVWATVTLALLAASASPSLIAHIRVNSTLTHVIGDPTETVRLTAIYCIGINFFLFRRWIIFRPLFAVSAAAAIAGVRMFDPDHMELALALFGGYLMFYFGQVSMRSLHWMKNIPDISYGIYLYGWPVEALWIWRFRGSPWVAFIISTVSCFILGWLSWHFVERPMLKLKRRQSVPLPPA